LGTPEIFWVRVWSWFKWPWIKKELIWVCGAIIVIYVANHGHVKLNDHSRSNNGVSTGLLDWAWTGVFYNYAWF